MKKTALQLLLLLVLPALVMAEGTTNERGLDPNNFDNSCEPCKDFYQFSNGNWLKNNPIPAEYSAWGMGHEVYERNLDLLKEILEEASQKTNAPEGSAWQKIGDFYASAMGTERIEAEGAAPLQSDWKRINSMSSKQDIQKVVTAYHAEGFNMLFDLDAIEDLKNSEEIIAYATQGGLGLPDRDYYTREDDESVELRAKYVEHVANMFKLLGDDPEAARTQAEKILAMETRLAEVSLTNVELRDPANFYNVVAMDEADQLSGNFAWSEFFDGIDQGQLTSFSYAHPKFFEKMNKMMDEVPIDDWKSYMRFHVVSGAAPFLSSAFVDENFDFYSTTLRGTEELRPRWKRVLTVADGVLGEVLGEIYVERAFPPRSKQKALDMVNDLRAALRVRLENLEWMSDETKEKALAKYASFRAKIGYPDKWRDYSDLEITRGSYFENVRRGRAFARADQLAQIGEPIDETRWEMNPQTVNAYYHPLKNEIVFPAAMLQPPYFDPDMDDAVNYGAMGAVIGHELMHGYDDQGSKFDADGNMQDWWTETDRTNFEARTAGIVSQFSSYVAVDTQTVNGELTQGENIADLGGLIIAYAALQSRLEGNEQTKIDGFTPEQRFFLSWAQAWRTNYRDEGLKLQLNTDPHSPGKFRTNGPLSNLAEFHEAFGCTKENQMVRSGEEHVNIW